MLLEREPLERRLMLALDFAIPLPLLSRALFPPKSQAKAIASSRKPSRLTAHVACTKDQEAPSRILKGSKQGTRMIWSLDEALPSLFLSWLYLGRYSQLLQPENSRFFN